MASGKSKGSSFEREMAKYVSLWWTDDERDDVFWRTSNSGGRATVRSRSEQETFGQYGDLQATDPIGQPLIDFFSIEIKRGYKGATIADVLDRPTKVAMQPWEKWAGSTMLNPRRLLSWILSLEGFLQWRDIPSMI